MLDSTEMAVVYGTLRGNFSSISVYRDTADLSREGLLYPRKPRFQIGVNRAVLSEG
jgi:hypothetical protein